MAGPYPQVVLFGDSLLQQSVGVQDGFSFQAELQTHCIRKMDVVNRGFSGWNTNNAIKYFEQIFPEPTAASAKIDFLIVLLGANDAVIPLEMTAQHVPLDKYKENLTAMINHPHIKAHKPKILLVTPPPLDEIKAEKIDLEKGFPQCTRTAAISATYSQAAREVAEANEGVHLIDLWQGLMDKAIAMTPTDYQPGGPWLGTKANGKAGGLDVLLPDGLHMNGDAYRVLYDLVSPHIGAHWTGNPETDRTEFVLPDWRDINIPPSGRQP